MKILARIVGLVLLAAALAAVFLFRASPPAGAEDLSVRPVKVFSVAPRTRRPPLFLPGSLDARSSVDLSFEVSGRLVSLPVKNGQHVRKNQVLARLDDHDFANQLKEAQAACDLAESSLSRIAGAFELNAVSQDELSRAQAARDQARARLDIAAKALSNATLRASFSGVVARTCAREFDTLAAGTPVLCLQDPSAFDLNVSVPESLLLRLGPGRPGDSISASAEFDAIPGRSFDVAFKEFATAADPVTRTFRATFTLVPPEDNAPLFLPGMSASIRIDLPDDPGSPVLSIPSSAVAYAADASPFVWVLSPENPSDPDSPLLASARPVSLGERSGDSVAVLSGLSRGESIAAAGVSMLSEGRRLRPFAP